MSLGILSRFELSDMVYTTFSNPNLTAVGPNGKNWVLFDKGYVSCFADINGKKIGLLNVHGFPLRYFGASPTEDRFSDIWAQLAHDMTALQQKVPTIVAGDFNCEYIEKIIGTVLGSDGYKNAFVANTIPADVQLDYILTDRRMELLDTMVKSTESDHSYCQATVCL